jgi:hypothetical protein
MKKRLFFSDGPGEMVRGTVGFIHHSIVLPGNDTYKVLLDVFAWQLLKSNT